jgi:Htaa
VKRSIPLAVATLAVTLAAAPSASAAVGLSGGSTQVTLNAGTAKALGSLGVSVAPTGRAKARGTRVAFPITGGSIDPATAAGTIRHRGGLRFRGHGNAITLKDYVVTVGRRVRLSARVGASRVTVLNLTGTPKVTRSGFNTNISGLTAELTSAAAKALNTTFGVRAFRKGVKLGRVQVAAKVRATELVATGQTGLTIDPAALQALTSLGVAPGVVAPATLTGTTANFPITGGKVMLNLSSGLISHSGGISLTKGATAVALTDFDIRLGATPQLFAAVNGGTPKVAIADLDLTGVTPAVAGRTITLDGVTVKLTQGAADALNGAFGTTAFAAGLVLGKAKVEATGK